MREAAFLKQRSAHWRIFERSLEQTDVNPDMLANLYIELTDDLSYAQTNYPESNTTTYLNELAQKVHGTIYKNKKEQKGRFVKFWKYELPALFWKYHKQLLYSFLIFFISGLVGALSSAHDKDFVRLIMGDAYVNMTLENIKNGDPMKVYKEMNESDMFLGITLNNILVSFRTFAMGIMLSVGSAFMLFYNGIMLGAFQYFFYEHGVLLESVLTIWIHGTLEISAIIIAGCAGLVMGNGFLFPGTYTRMESFTRGAKDGLKITIGLVPIFILAGFLESFVTRHTEMHWLIKVIIIGVSALFILWYFIVYPLKLKSYVVNPNRISTKP